MVRARIVENEREVRPPTDGWKRDARLAGAVPAWGAVGALIVLLAAVLAWARPRLEAFATRQAAHASLARDSGDAALWLGFAIRLGARDPMLRVERAWHLARAGRRAEALAAYRRAARVLPPHAGDAEYGAARVLAEMGELGAAEEMLDAAIARDASVLFDVRHDDDLRRVLGGRPRFEAWMRD